ncbi:MAG: hypothetical protein E7278_09120 [Lachnospiraceae bacterium]|jgi:hypothetical protein|nr:hypothetical protein [Lachnospiraceae bacterium]
MMKTYEKPVVIENKDLAEGVFAASGDSSSDCWAAYAITTQASNGSHHVYEVHATHSKSVEHITSNVVYTLSFPGATITDAYSEGPNTVSYTTDTVTVTRDLHANGYKSGDEVSFKVWVKSIDDASTKGLADQPAVTYVCRHDVNVQGRTD